MWVKMSHYRQMPNVILGTFGHQSSMPMVVFDWQGMTFY